MKKNVHENTCSPDQLPVEFQVVFRTFLCKVVLYLTQICVVLLTRNLKGLKLHQCWQGVKFFNRDLAVIAISQKVTPNCL